MEDKIKNLLHSGIASNINLALLLIRTQCPDFDVSPYENLWYSYDYHLPRLSLQDGLEWLLTLEEFDFGYMCLEALPDFVCHLEHVHTLILEHTNIGSLPKHLGNMAGLQKLDISHTRISNLPESIVDLKNLKRLNLMNTEIPRSQRLKLRQKLPDCEVFI